MIFRGRDLRIQMLTTFAQKRAAILLKMADEIDALHSLATTSGSRITSLP